MSGQRCRLFLTEEHHYGKEVNVEPYPKILVGFHRPELEGVLRVEALLDTGFDGALILSRTLCNFLSERVSRPDGFEELDAAGIGIPCNLYEANIQLAKRWFRVRAHAPQLGDLGTILGRVLMNRVTFCLRGASSKLHLCR